MFGASSAIRHEVVLTAFADGEKYMEQLEKIRSALLESSANEP